MLDIILNTFPIFPMIMRKREILNRMNRRSFLKRAGVSTLALSNLPHVVKAKGNWVTIVTATRRGEPIDTRKVPKEWYKNWQKALEVRDGLINQYRNSEKFVGIGIGNDSAEVEDHRLNSLVVRFKDENVDVDIPEQAHGIPVEFEVDKGSEPAAAYDDPYDPVVGGVKLDSASGGYGSAYCRGYLNGTYYIMGANHILHDSGTCADVDTTGNKIYQPGAGNQIGNVDHYYPSFDLFLTEVDMNRTYGVEDEIVTQPGSIQGIRTKSGMSSDASSNVYYSKNGVGTGENMGTLVTTDFCTYSGGCWNCGWYEASMYAASGDSGAPVFYQDGNDDIHIGFMISTISGSSTPQGRAGWKLENKTDIYIF